jgi:hypothetical protein
LEGAFGDEHFPVGLDGGGELVDDERHGGGNEAQASHSAGALTVLLPIFHVCRDFDSAVVVWQSVYAVQAEVATKQLGNVLACYAEELCQPVGEYPADAYAVLRFLALSLPASGAILFGNAVPPEPARPGDHHAVSPNEVPDGVVPDSPTAGHGGSSVPDLTPELILQVCGEGSLTPVTSLRGSVNSLSRRKWGGRADVRAPRPGRIGFCPLPAGTRRR